MINSTLSGNTAPLGAGGLFTISGSATVINGTITNNHLRVRETVAASGRSGDVT